MNKALPLVSVIMPVHNAGRFLVSAIESILNQTYPRIELLLVDDQSTDGSWKMLKAYKRRFPKNIRLFRTPTKLNAAGNGATDIGLSHAKGTFMARMDADDVALAKRIEKQVAFLVSHPDVLMVGTQATVIDHRGRRVGVKRVPTAHEDIYTSYGLVHPMIHPSIMVHRSLLPNPNKLYYHKWGVNDDYYTFFKLLQYGRFANLSEPLLKYRVHGGNASLGDVKQTIKNTIGIRLEAVTRLGYPLTVPMIGAMILQGMVALLMPSRALNALYPIARGMKPIKLPTLSFTRSLPRLSRPRLAYR